MRVVVAADRVGGLSGYEAGLSVARAWRDAGAQVALIPAGARGADLVQALLDAGVATASPPPVSARTQDLLLVLPDAGDPSNATGTSLPIGQAVADALGDPRPAVAVDLTTVTAHDGGAGLLAGLGARADVPLDGGVAALTGLESLDMSSPRAALDGRDLVGLVDPEELTMPLTGLRGTSSVRGRELGTDLSEILRADRALGRLAEHAGVDPFADGGGAAGGCGAAILALGGRLTTAPALADECAGLSGSVRQADLLVGACTSLDMGSHGGALVRYLSEVGARAGTPVVVMAGNVSVGTRELRSTGIEAAFVVEAASMESLQMSVARVASSWMW